MADVLERWNDSDVLFVEPSAGTGAFLHPLQCAERKVKAVDVDPQSLFVERMDFLTAEEIFDGDHSAIVVLGNPPFGKNACMAVKFFNKAAIYADEISFIVPRTFRKRSLQRRLHPKFHLFKDRDVEPNAFIRLGNPYDVPCAWQVWKRFNQDRLLLKPPSVEHLITYTTPGNADFAMRRVGFYAGRVVTENILSLSVTTHYFISELTEGVVDSLKEINWTDLASQTVGVRSLSKVEIAFKLYEAINA